MKARSYIPQMDGVRAFAIGLVLIAHSAVDLGAFHLDKWSDRYGSPGVQVFFVLSGFLITGILLSAKDKPGYFVNFYARRGLRIWPLYYVVLAIVIFSGLVHRHGASWWPYLLYVSNLFAHKTQPAPFGPLWSLAVEEQFYLVWPFVVWKLSRINLIRLAIGIAIATPILRATLPLGVHNTLFEIDALAVGALIAAYRGTLHRLRPLAWVLVWVLPLGVTWQTVQVYGGASLLLLALDDNSIVARGLRNFVLVYIGKISYGLYLLHSFVISAFQRTHLHARVIASNSPVKLMLYLLLEGAVIVGLASASYFAFEKPLLRLKKYFEYGRKPKFEGESTRPARA
jgi:peptidoglycan/LPS O-acetylase OafA/YrhL